MKVGDYIGFYRRKEHLTQHELAQKAGISRSYLGDLEKNRYNPSLECLMAIASALDVKTSLLLGEENERPGLLEKPNGNIWPDENLMAIIRRLEGMSENDRKKAFAILRRALDEIFGL